jgi:hypothetical protein
VIILCSNSTKTNAARAMRPILPVTCWSVFHRWVSSAKPRSPRQRTKRISAFRGPGADIQFLDPSGLLHRDVDTVTCAFVPGIGQDGHGVQERAQHGQHVLPGRGQVMHTERFSSFDLVGLKYMDGFGELTGLPRAPAEFAQDTPGS